MSKEYVKRTTSGRLDQLARNLDYLKQELLEIRGQAKLEAEDALWGPALDACLGDQVSENRRLREQVDEQDMEINRLKFALQREVVRNTEYRSEIGFLRRGRRD